MKRAGLIVVLGLWMTVSATVLQPRESAAFNQGGRSFNSALPEVGELVPDISLYAADGKPFELRSLKGAYTVLVFGCLT